MNRRTETDSRLGEKGQSIVLVRDALVADAEALQAFATRLYAERLPTIFLHEQGPTLEEEREFIHGFAGSRHRLLVACAGPELVGMLGFRGHGRAQLKHSGVMALSVSKAYRRCGIGTRMLRTLCDWVARHEFLARVELDVFSTNTGAVALFQQEGFEVEGVMRRAIDVQGRRIDNLLMARCFDVAPTNTKE